MAYDSRATKVGKEAKIMAMGIRDKALRDDFMRSWVTVVRASQQIRGRRRSVDAADDKTTP